MNQAIARTGAAAFAACGLLAGCATTVDMGGPLGHYRYNYDSRPVVSERTVVPDRLVTYPAPATEYRERTYTYTVPATTYAAPAVTYTAPETTYTLPSTSYGAPATAYSPPSTTTYGSPAAAYGAPSTAYDSRTFRYDWRERHEDEPTVIYRESRVIERAPAYDGPSVVYEWHPSPSLPYQEHGQ
jgi:hypothetical protein